MTQPTGDTRQLNYPLNRVENLVVETPNTPPINDIVLNWQTTDNDERVPVVLSLSLNEYVALATSVDVGRDLAYGQNSIYIWWIWVRSVMQFCEQIIECIENDTDVIDAINNAIYQQTINQLRESAQQLATFNLGAGNNPTCDKDVLFGGIISVVDRANQNNVDALQAFEVATNDAELISLIFPNTAEDGTSIINAMIDWILWMQENIIENYEAQITTGYLEEIYCDLFCMSKDTCELTPEMLVNYFSDRLSSAITFESLFTETVAFLITGEWSGTEIADVFFLSQFAIRSQIGGWLEFLGFADIDRDMRIGFLQPNATWSILCTDCPDTWTHTFDFTVDDGGWVARNIWGTGNCAVYSSGNGWSTQDRYNGATEYSRLIAIERTFTPDTVITNVEFEYNASAFTYGAGLNTMIGLSIATFLDGTSQASYTQLLQACQAGTGILRGNPDDATGDAIRLFLRCSLFETVTYQNTALITSCTVTGEGTNPFE